MSSYLKVGTKVVVQEGKLLMGHEKADKDLKATIVRVHDSNRTPSPEDLVYLAVFKDWTRGHGEGKEEAERMGIEHPPGASFWIRYDAPVKDAGEDIEITPERRKELDAILKKAGQRVADRERALDSTDLKVTVRKRDWREKDKTRVQKAAGTARRFLAIDRYAHVFMVRVSCSKYDGKLKHYFYEDVPDYDDNPQEFEWDIESWVFLGEICVNGQTLERSLIST